jgi:hypothetical protein
MLFTRAVFPDSLKWALVERAATDRSAIMSDFYGIKPGTVPGFAESGAGRFMSVEGLPERTVRHMLSFMEKLRGMYEADPLAFEVCVRHVATVIEDQRRGEGKDDPREDSAP